MIKLIRADELAAMLSCSTTTIWRMEKRGDLPPKIRISANIVGWRLSDIEAWLDQKLESSEDLS